MVFERQVGVERHSKVLFGEDVLKFMVSDCIPVSVLNIFDLS